MNTHISLGQFHVHQLHGHGIRVALEQDMPEQVWDLVVKSIDVLDTPVGACCSCYT